MELSASQCEVWYNHSAHLHGYVFLFDKSIERVPHWPLRCPRTVILDGQAQLKYSFLLFFNSTNLQLCLLPSPILHWFPKHHSPLKSSLRKRLWAEQTQVRCFWMEPKAPDNSQVKRINFITMLLTHPFQSGLTLLFSKCYSPVASGTSHICIFIRSVCTVLNPMVTTHLIPDSLCECWSLFL